MRYRASEQRVDGERRTPTNTKHTHTHTHTQAYAIKHMHVRTHARARARARTQTHTQARLDLSVSLPSPTHTIHALHSMKHMAIRQPPADIHNYRYYHSTPELTPFSLFLCPPLSLQPSLSLTANRNRSPGCSFRRRIHRCRNRLVPH